MTDTTSFDVETLTTEAGRRLRIAQDLLFLSGDSGAHSATCSAASMQDCLYLSIDLIKEAAEMVEKINVAGHDIVQTNTRRPHLQAAE
ncbi:hypothetical protein [Hwanghaeella sp.]|uniref:hypothetical protein n=1 Tax=Hwanghaeella sp. TaxID=2605943 RepID=UPI003CCB9318